MFIEIVLGKLSWDKSGFFLDMIQKCPTHSEAIHCIVYLDSFFLPNYPLQWQLKFHGICEILQNIIGGDVV